MKDALNKKDFLQAVKEYSKNLELTKNFDEAHSLWQRTNIPYKYVSQDPLSPEYGEEVLQMYRELTQNDYNNTNEMTSTKQSAEDFNIGFPWISRNLQAIAQEFVKISQAMLAIHKRNRARNRIIEFGSGWGNLAIPLAKAGQEVSVVDIDDGFLERLKRVAERENVDVQCFLGDFVDVSKSIVEKYDLAIFQASFHHCLNFIELVETIRDNVLSHNGAIIFFSEPIVDNYPFPWGLRFDGESLWAITQNKWLELGFDRDFFVDFMLRSGFLMSHIASVPGIVGEGWLAQTGPEGVAFENWVLPNMFSDTFHPTPSDTGHGRFCREMSKLPSLKGSFYSRYDIVFRNYGPDALTVKITSGKKDILFSIQPNGEHTAVCVADDDNAVQIVSDVFCPKDRGVNEDTRLLGAAINRISLS